jgi:hypothetical protein
MEVVDIHFDVKPVPDITLIFQTDYLTKKIINEVENKKPKNISYYSMNGFQVLYQEIKTLVDCEIIKNELKENCDNIRQKFIDIITLYPRDLLNLFENKHKFSNESIIQNFKKFVPYIILNFPQFNIRDRNTNENVSQRILYLDKSYWKRTPIIRISTNSSGISKFNLDFTTNKNYVKDLKVFSSDILWNKEHYLAKKSFKFLEIPYKSSCSYYDSSQTIFNSLSHEHCVRLCLRHFCELQLNCSCFLDKHQIEVYSIISQYDEDLKSDSICTEKNLNSSKFYFDNINNCINLCPINCINDEYIITNRKENQKLSSDPNKWEITIHWDDSKPLIVNKETPDMKLTDYFGYIGGLFGMWFGISANQLFQKLRDNYFTYCRTFKHFCILLFYISLEIIFALKSIFHSILRHLFHY